MPVDTSIAMGVRPVQFDNPVEGYQRVMALKNIGLQGQLHAAQLQEDTRKQEEQLKLADIYRSSVGADGTPNHPAILQGMAASGIGHLIPGYRKTMLDANKDQADIDLKGAQTKKSEYDVQMGRLNARAGALQSLLSKPNATHEDVITSLVNLANDGVITMDQGRKAVQQLPPDPAALRQYLMQQGLQVMDAAKRTEMLAPKLTQVDDNSRINMGTTNMLTGQFTPGKEFIQKVATPGDVLQSNTSRANNRDSNTTSRANNLDSNTTSRANNTTTTAEAARGHDLTFQSANTKIEQTPNGFVVVNTAGPKGPTSTPVFDVRGAQVQQKDSPLWKAQQQYQKLTVNIADAKRLIPLATGSGAGALVDKGLGFTGIGTGGADAAGQLEVIGGWMTSNVPRMEGPQSDKDTEQYKQMAAQVGNRTVPASVRLKALETLEKIQNDYKHMNQGPAAKDSVVRIENQPGAGPRPPLSAFER